MKLTELFEEVILETDEVLDDEFDIVCETAKPIWARSGNKIVRKYRCTSGKKQGMIVSNPATCGGSIDLKKRMNMKKMLQKRKTIVRRKAQKVKKRNPVSIRLQKLNKAAGR